MEHADLTDEIRGELGTLRSEYGTNEDMQAALKIAGDAPTTHYEKPDLVRAGHSATWSNARSNVGEIFAAAVGNRGH